MIVTEPLPPPILHLRSDRSFTALAISPDGRMLATGSYEGLISVRDLGASERPAWEVRGHDAAADITALAFAPGGAQLASGGADGTILLWDVTRTGLTQAGRIEGVVPPLQMVTGPLSRPCAISPASNVSPLCFSPDGRWLVTGAGTPSRRGLLRVWDLARPGTPRWWSDLEAQRNPVKCLVFSSDGSLLASGSCLDRGGHVVLWDLASGSPRRVQRRHDYYVTAIALSADGALAATAAGLDTAVMLWETATGRVEWKFRYDERAAVTWLDLDPGASRIAAADSRGMVIVDVARRAARRLVSDVSEGSTSVLSQDWQRLASVTIDYELVVWDLSGLAIQ